MFLETLPAVFAADIAESGAAIEQASSNIASRSHYCCGSASDSFIFVDNLQSYVRQDVFQGDGSLRAALVLGAGSLCHPQCGRRLPNRPNLQVMSTAPICIRLDRGGGSAPPAPVSIHRFADNVGLRDAISSGRGKECLHGLTCPAPLTCPDLHVVDPTSDSPSLTCRGNHGDDAAVVLGLVKDHRPPQVSILVVELRKQCHVNCFLPNSGLQNAIRFGRGKLCRLESCCPNPRRCPLLHVGELHKGIVDHRAGRMIADKPIWSLFVRNLNCRMNAWDFLGDVGLQQALALGEGCLCTGHEGHASCALLHLDHYAALRQLWNCKSLSLLRGFAAGFGLGTILPEYKRTNQRGTMAELDAQRRTVEQAYQSQFRTTKSLADVAA